MSSNLAALITMFAFFAFCSACSVLLTREEAIERAVDQVKETMRVAIPDMPHPEPHKYEDSGDCAWVPGLNSTKETLRFQAKVLLPPGDNGLERQANALQYWIEKGATVRDLPHRTGPPAEVEYRGGRIMAFPLPGHLRGGTPDGNFTFHVSATTPCIPKAEQ
jgi:hypothetical protein